MWTFLIVADITTFQEFLVGVLKVVLKKGLKHTTGSSKPPASASKFQGTITYFGSKNIFHIKEAVDNQYFQSRRQGEVKATGGVRSF